MRIDDIVVRLMDSELLSGIKRITSNERKVQCQFITYLAEVEKRELYLKQGFSSLFTFVVSELGYSEAEALKRIQVARKARSLPLIYYALSEGRLSMTALCRLCPYLNQGNVDELLSECEKKSVREVERIIVRHFPKDGGIDSFTKIDPLSEDKIQVQFTAPASFGESLEKARAILSHKYPQGRLCDVLGEALALLLEKQEPRKKEKTPNCMSRDRLQKEESPRSRYIPKAIKAAVWERDEGKCTYVGPTGHRCAETKFLNYDHLNPYALGGESDSVSNIRLTCRRHNVYLAKIAFGTVWTQRLIELKRRQEQRLP